MTEKVRFCVVGCGRVSSKHLDAISTELKNAELIAVCDIKADRAKDAGLKYGVPWYTNSVEMLKAHPEVEVINILTPSGDHPKNLIELAHYGKHFVVEKPMALTLEDAEEMIRVCTKQGSRLFVVKQNRYNLPIQKLREAVEADRFGKMVMGTIRVRWCHIDMLTWMMGDVESVFCYTATRLVNVETEDTAVAVLKFSNGSLGIVEATTAARPKDLEGSISILGEKGTVEIGGFAMNEMKTWQFKEKLSGDDEVIKSFKENPPNVYGFGHARFLEKVTDVIRSGKGGSVDGLEGMKSLILINAMYESMETGKEVPLRFKAHKAKLGRK